MIVGGKDQQTLNKFLTTLGIYHVHSIDTEKFKSLMLEEDMDIAIEKFVNNTSFEGQHSIINGCCIFKEESNINFNLGNKPFGIIDESKPVDIDRQLKALEKQLKYSKNYMERSRLSKQIMKLRRYKNMEDTK